MRCLELLLTVLRGEKKENRHIAKVIQKISRRHHHLPHLPPHPLHLVSQNPLLTEDCHLTGPCLYLTPPPYAISTRCPSAAAVWPHYPESSSPAPGKQTNTHTHNSNSKYLSNFLFLGIETVQRIPSRPSQSSITIIQYANPRPICSFIGSYMGKICCMESSNYWVLNELKRTQTKSATSFFNCQLFPGWFQTSRDIVLKLFKCFNKMSKQI